MNGIFFFCVIEYKHDYFPDEYHLPLCSLPAQPELEQGKFPLSPIWGNDVDKQHLFYKGNYVLGCRPLLIFFI